MTDNTRVNELQDKLLKAMDILNAQALNSISFDKTITCTIENDENKKDGKYEVNDGSSIFTAYSTDERYHNGEVVYVTIPQGDYENQKMIIGKKTSETEKPFNFVTPFDTMFDMTANQAGTKVTDGELIANALNKYREKTETKDYQNLLIYHNSNCVLSNYTRLGLKANFKSWIKNAVSGDYGLHLILTEKTSVTAKEAEQLQKELAEDQITQEQYDEKIQGINFHSVLLNSSNMYGNPYSFETEYEQQIVIPIEKIKGVITDIKIYFYQDSNFYDKFNEPIPCSLNGFKTYPNTNIYEPDSDGDYQLKDNDNLLACNLFVNKVYLCMGYDISIFSDDYVEIYTQDRNSYRRSTNPNSEDANLEINQKEIKMRWVHIKDGVPVDMVAAADKATEEEKEKYEVRWYKYHVGAAAADAYCGIYWERIEEATGFDYVFNPDVNKQQEKIKAVVIYDSNTPYRSNELLFENEEQLPLSEEAQHILNALVIECDDGTNGNYMVYGQDNSIKDTAYGKETRTLTAYFDANNDGKIDEETEIVQQFDNLEWIFPIENTMLVLLNGRSYDEIQLIEYTKNTFYIKNEDEYEKDTEDIFDPNKTYYDLIDGEYIEITNLYKPGVYYIQDYVNCEYLKFDSIENTYYKFNESENEYEQVINLSLEQYEADRTGYYIYTYTLCYDENYNKDLTYYQYNISNSGKVSNTKPQYKIESYYSPNKSNNTITCKYTLNGVVYTSEKEFTFGPAGTMGTDQTLVIDFVGDKNSVIVGEEVVNFEVRLYDKQNKQQTISDNSVEWKWYYNSNLNLEDRDFPYDIQDAKNAIYSCQEKFNIEGLYILQATVGNLTTYFPIPVSDGAYSYIKGPTQVIYQSSGEPVYSREDYGLYGKDDKKIEGVKWYIKPSETVYTYKQVRFNDDKQYEADKYYIKKYGSVTINNEDDYKANDKLYVWDDITKTYVISAEYVTDVIYYIENGYTLSKTANKNDSKTYYEQIVDAYIGNVEETGAGFKPLSIFVKDAPIYGIEAKIGTTVVWTQPILVLQNQWPNGVINAWDGESLVLDEENSTILATAISAGKKNSDNTFSGVMLGNWEGQDVEGSITRQTGIYGFHHGAQSYAFKEDGTGFIGKASMARINFDGNNATIQSAGYNTNAGGMMINLYNKGAPFIALQSKKIEGQPYSEMRFDTKTGGSTIYLKKDNQGQEIKITNADADNPLKIGNNFSVKWNGNIKATGGTIGGWQITETTLESNEGYIRLDMDGHGTIRLDSPQSIISGGTIKAGILSSTDDKERIKLKGYLSIDVNKTDGKGNVIKDENGDIVLTNVGSFGYLPSNFPGFGGVAGLGMYAIGGSNANIKTYVKATGQNAGISFIKDETTSSFLSVSDCLAQMGQSNMGFVAQTVLDKNQIPTNKERIAMVFSETENNSTYITLMSYQYANAHYTNPGKLFPDHNKVDPILYVSGVPASNQFGIYARFA